MDNMSRKVCPLGPGMGKWAGRKREIYKSEKEGRFSLEEESSVSLRRKREEKAEREMEKVGPLSKFQN